MNRTTPLRRTPLRAMSEQREQELRDAGLVPVSTFRPRTNWREMDRQVRHQWRVSRPQRPTTEFSPATIEAALEREHNSCARCGRGVGAGRGMFWSGQHRRARQGIYLSGTADIANCLILCGSAATGCHSIVERRLEAERVKGYWVHQFADGRPTDPTTVPVLHSTHGWVLLNNEGGWERYEERAA